MLESLIRLIYFIKPIVCKNTQCFGLSPAGGDTRPAVVDLDVVVRETDRDAWWTAEKHKALWEL